MAITNRETCFGQVGCVQGTSDPSRSWSMLHDPGRLARKSKGGRAPDPVSRGTRRRSAVRPAHADTESLTQHGSATGWVQRGRITRGAICATPWRAIGDKGPYTVTVSPQAGRRPVNPRARNCPGTAVPGPVRGSASGHWAGARLSRPNRSAYEAQVSSRFSAYVSRRTGRAA
jgi:hypothetical protein